MVLADDLAREVAVLPLTAAQEAVWLDMQAFPHDAAFNVGGPSVLEGPCDMARLHESLRTLIQRNDALRLAPRPDGRQALLSHWEPAIEYRDLRHSTGTVHDAIEAAMRRPFLLDGRTPPWRCAVLSLSGQQHVIVIAFHHLVADGLSTALFLRKWASAYNEPNPAEGADSPAPASFADAIDESGRYRSAPEYVRDREFWSGQVPELPPPLLPVRRWKAEYGVMAPAHMHGRSLPRSLLAAMQAFSAPRGASVFHLLLAMLALYFARAYQRDEVVIGVPMANRVSRRFRTALGMFVQVLPVRIAVPADATVDDLLIGASRAMHRAIRHGRFPPAEITRRLAALGSGRGAPFDVVLSYVQQDCSLSFGAAALRDSRQWFSGLARYPLTVTVCDFQPEADPDMHLAADPAVLSASEVALLADRLVHLAESMLREPSNRCSDIRLPSADEWDLLAIRPYRRNVGEAQPPTVPERWAAQVACSPERTALVWDHGDMTYRDLDQHAARIARCLRSMGAQRDRLVLVAMERSPGLVASLLGTMLAGAAYVPLDPDTPPQRLQTILSDHAVCCLIASSTILRRLDVPRPPTLIVEPMPVSSDTGGDRAAAEERYPTPNDLAYVMFTSGSTGAPKGVMIEHGSLGGRLHWFERRYGMGPETVSLQSSLATFDPSVIEMLLPLVLGGTVALPPPGPLDAEHLARFAARQATTFTIMVPTQLRALLRAAAGKERLAFEVMCCGGEEVPAALANEYLAQVGGRLFNAYGPTEATVLATAWDCVPSPEDQDLPIGTPIDDTVVHVLAPDGQLAPIGVPGEIYLGGGGLARGYLGRPDLDAQRFLPDPFDPSGQGRLYRTGDRGYLDAGGQLHFLGRLDRQVKVRGHRIEPGEVEVALRAHPAVTAAAVKAIGEGSERNLHGWVVLTPHATAPSTEDLRRHLRRRLPDYMVPPRLTVLSALPVGGTGKVDMAALPAPAPALAAAGGEAAAPGLPAAIAALWARELGVDTVAASDDFFALGGDSLRALGMLARLEGMIGRRVPLSTLVQQSTLAGFAEAVTASGAPAMLVPLGRWTEGVPVYLAASGNGDPVRYRRLADALGPDCATYMLQPTWNGLGRPDFTTLRELAERYADLIAARGGAPAYVAGFSIGGVAALETARVLHERGLAARGVGLIDTVAPSITVRWARLWARAFQWSGRWGRPGVAALAHSPLGVNPDDPGLVAQVLALPRHTVLPYAGQVDIVHSAWLAPLRAVFFGGWHDLLGGTGRHMVAPGIHGSMFSPANAPALAQALRPCIVPCGARPTDGATVSRVVTDKPLKHHPQPS